MKDVQKRIKRTLVEKVELADWMRENPYLVLKALADIPVGDLAEAVGRDIEAGYLGDLVASQLHLAMKEHKKGS